MSNDNTNKTSTKRKRDNEEEDPPIYILKNTRNEVKLSNSNCIKWRPKYDKITIKPLKTSNKDEQKTEKAH